MKAKILIFILIISTLLYNCDKSTVDSKNIDLPQNVVSATNNFAMKYWAAHEKFETKNKNYMVSPLSLHIALGMLLNGADTDTKTEIQNTLGLNNISLDQINASYKTLIETLPKVDPAVTNTIANAIFQDKKLSVEKAFTDNLSNNFSAKLFIEDFSNAATVKKINQWASDNTNQKITKILDQIEPSQVMFILNALYFKGDWAKAFKVKDTRKEVFAGSTIKSTVDMMYQTETFDYAQTPNMQLISLPYGNEKYTMYVVLPKDNIDATLKTINSGAWTGFKESLVKTKVIVGLPKFKIEYNRKLNDVLQDMGMKKVFTDQADLSKISAPAGKLKVGFVKQDTFISVDEKGTEAAAVTTIGIETTSVPIYPEFIANKPFLFIIAEKTSNTVMFMGKVNNL